VHGVIAGTEPYNKETLENANDLKVISRVGVGLDSIDFEACDEKNIKVTYTPEAPAEGVADLALAQIINLFRSITISDKSVKNGLWTRTLGFLLSEKNIGVLGVGRIGSRVIKRLQSFGCDPIYACDLSPGKKIPGVTWASKEDLFKLCDLVTIHIPLNKDNYHCVGIDEMSSMKHGSFIVNTSRGSVVDENSLESLILNDHLGGAALDVFEEEPYKGILTELDNVILTAHIGASAYKSRYLMELGAVEDCIRVLKGDAPLNLVSC
jgi:D-3-phosphoglycerate dehydrogenase / 2-oxoglutarate reductase